MVAAVDWSTRPHSYGHDPSVLAVWDAEIEGDERARRGIDPGLREMGNLVCHQGTISLAAFALVEPLVAIGTSLHPRRARAIETLACFLSTAGGNAAHQARLHARMGTVPNPFRPGEMMTSPGAPAEGSVAEEQRAIREMRDRVEAELETWMALAEGESLGWDVRLPSLWLLAGVMHHPDSDEAERVVRDVYATVDAEKRESMSFIIGDLDREEPDFDEEE